MKLKVSSNDIIVTPSICKGQEEAIEIHFSQPNAPQVLELLATNNYNKLLNDCFKKFVNKPELEDDNGKNIEYGTFEEMMSFGGTALSIIYGECLNELAKNVKKLSEEAKKTEKKSKSAKQSSKQAS